MLWNLTLNVSNIWTTNNNIMQHHANNVGPVFTSTQYSYTEHS